MKKIIHILLILFSAQSSLLSQDKSIARIWNETLLEAIRNDYARPTVHARNLFHSSVLMYDSWALYTDGIDPYFAGTNKLGNYFVELDALPSSSNRELAINEVMSYAVSTLIKHRFQNAPKFSIIEADVSHVMDSLGYDESFVSTDYSNGSYAALGNYLAEKMIDFGLNDGSNEQNEYENQFYNPTNGLLYPAVAGNAEATNFNSWQPLTLDIFIDQSGNVTPNNTPEFLTPEWGNVIPYALSEEDKTIFSKYGTDLNVYHDPGAPVFMTDSSTDSYKWGFSMVVSWASHLDTNDLTMIDISPNAIGNLSTIPESPSDYASIYNFTDGGDYSPGHALNPITNEAYAQEMVPRADYARVLAEFWADGPDSETPPGHWFTILNYVSDHSDFEKKWKGQGNELDNLEWDVKSYLTLGGAMHDAAISAWSIKGYYDYIRPISAIRLMAERGQCSDNSLPSYHANGLPLINGLIELVDASDPLSGNTNENVGKIKIYSWKGPDYISNEDTDIAGVGWILAENWWPYQRPSFVTPPFAGYVSGHSVFSRAAAEVLTSMTGSPYFPGGLGTFTAKQNDFLVFEKGPSVDIELQWATYRDASDQTSLSRIYGGIHPPIDDIPGRLIGQEIGVDAFNYTDQFFEDATGLEESLNTNEVEVFPNPVRDNKSISIISKEPVISISILSTTGTVLDYIEINDLRAFTIPTPDETGILILSIETESGITAKKIKCL